MAARTHVGAANKFLKAATWLTDEDAPAVTTLLALSKRLDTDPDAQAALFSQHGLVYRALLKRKPSAAGESDPLDDLLEEAGA